MKLKKIILSSFGCVVIGAGLFYGWSKIPTASKINNVLKDEINNAEQALKVPRFYIDKFPFDMRKNGSTELFFKIMLPLVLRENENLEYLRLEILRIGLKEVIKEPLTPEEQKLLDDTAKEYDILPTTNRGKILDLIQKVGAVPVSLALVQAIEAYSKNPDERINVFGQHSWQGDPPRWEITQYQSLADAVHGYALELNSQEPFFKIRWQRNRQREIKPQNFLNGGAVLDMMAVWRPDDKEYLKRLNYFFDRYQLGRFEHAKLVEIEGKEKHLLETIDPPVLKKRVRRDKVISEEELHGEKRPETKNHSNGKGN